LFDVPRQVGYQPGEKRLPQQFNVCHWLCQCGISHQRRLQNALAEPVAHFFNGLLCLIGLPE
jgi:hypothetical protein